MIYIKKYKDEETGTEHIEPTDVFKIKGYSEFDDKGQAAYFFLENIVRPMIEYFNVYSSNSYWNYCISIYFLYDYFVLCDEK